MSHYCLFVDESGDFGHPNPDALPSREWIISGILCPAEPSIVEDLIQKALDPVGKKYGLDSGDIKAWHLTELRLPINKTWATEKEKQLEKEERNNRANQIASDLFTAMLSLPVHMRFLTVINSSRSDVSNPEQTYRTMVTDLLALAESALPEEERISRLDMYVAVRTKNRRQMTTESQLNVNLKTLIYSAEVGLAARGLVDLIEHNLPGNGQKFNMAIKDYDKSWGFPVADFLANTVYNRNQSGSAANLDKLDQAGRLSQFMSLGAYEERRSHIAARDADYGAALYWWAISERRRPDYQEHFINLWRATAKSGAITTRAALEALIERFWQQAIRGSSYTRIFRQLQRTEVALTSLVGQPPDVRTLPLLFRLRNFMIGIANHIGDAERGRNLQDLQEADRPFLPFIPENLSLLLDLDLFTIELDVNDLNFSLARDLARQYFNTVESYRALWAKLNQNAVEDFAASRLYHRAYSTVVRAYVLAAEPLAAEAKGSSDDLKVALTMLQRFEELPLHPADRKRATNYRILAILKAGRADEALQIGLSQLSEMPDAFDALWAARAAADALAQGFPLQEEANKVLQILYNVTGDRSREAHPYELLWREQGFLERLIHGDEDAAERSFLRSNHLLERVRELSPINDWLWHVLQLHRRNGTTIKEDAFIKRFAQHPRGGGRLLAEKAVTLRKKRADLTLLSCVRLVSPY